MIFTKWYDMYSLTFLDIANFVKITYVFPVWQQNERKPTWMFHLKKKQKKAFFQKRYLVTKKTRFGRFYFLTLYSPLLLLTPPSMWVRMLYVHTSGSATTKPLITEENVPCISITINKCMFSMKTLNITCSVL